MSMIRIRTCMSLTRNNKQLFNNLRISFGHILILYHQDHAFFDSREDEEEKSRN